METEKHIKKSLDRISKVYPLVYNNNKETIDKLLVELHEWFDFFLIPPCSKIFGYAGRNCIKHREQRHHIEGIKVASYVFERKYGKEFREIILEESREHVIDDMGELYSFDDYTPRFWRGERD